MIGQDIFKYSSSNSNTDYDSDNSSYSSNSSNSSNYIITTVPINYYRKDILKQNYIKTLSRRKQQTQKHLELHRNKVKYNRNKNNFDTSDSDSSVIICKEVGYNSGFDKNTPLIDYLINKRINFCELGSSSHIAAFVPVTNNDWYCFIRGWKGKDRHG